MSVHVVVGGQYGSEAKAKAAVEVGMQATYEGLPVSAVRCGGPNAGHTVFIGDVSRVLRLVPSGVVVPHARLYISAGAMINIDLLLSEIKAIEDLGVRVQNRLYIDSQAAIVTQELIDQESSMALGASVGSTQTGTGSTASARALRTAKTMGMVFGVGNGRFNVLQSVGDELHNHLGGGCKVIIEGTQGFALSMYHSGYYPQSTSKDTTASAFAAEVGIAPFDVEDVTMVIRTYPIRVGGNSGPLPREISWLEVERRCGATQNLVEMTSVTRKVRRVGEFDWGLLKRAYQFNKPNHIAVHGADYLNWQDRCVTEWKDLSSETKVFVNKVESTIDTKVSMIFTGPHQRDMVTFK